MSENQNVGHGHVFPRPDGVRARCGGPAMCHVCAADLARKNIQASLKREPPHCSTCACGMDHPQPEAIRALWNKAVITQDGNRATVAFETAEEAETAFDYIHQLGSISQPPFVCLGGCGTSVPSPHAYCSACFLKARAEQRSEPPNDHLLREIRASHEQLRYQAADRGGVYQKCQCRYCKPETTEGGPK